MSKNKTLFEEAIADAKSIRETALTNAKLALEETLTPKLQSMLSAKLQEVEDDNDETLEEDFDLSEILKELDNETDETGEEGEGEEKEETAEKVKDLSVEEFTSLIKDIVSQELGNGTDAGMEDQTDDMGMDDMGSETGGEEMNSNDNEEINLDELLDELDALDENKEEDLDEGKKKDDKKEDDELKEAISVIKTLRKDLNEVNLLNAKLLYVNKIFKAKNLNESQKVKVISSFDKATTINEAKLIFQSLNTALTNNNNNKKIVKEGLGFASKAVGVIKKQQPIVEGADVVISRMQQLAGIIK